MEVFPEEVDIFVVPHSRMKQLVESYSNRLLCTDFTNCVAFDSFLCSLQQIFQEFKSHEQIENKLIMKKLKKKLKALSIYDSAVCNCHSDNKLSDVLDLVRDGYSCKRKSELERINYGRKLQHELKEFTNVFLPHMQEEEEVFQPMLMQYFEYDELKSLKEQVILEHTRWQLLNSDIEKFQWEQEDDAEHKSEELLRDENVFGKLPPEVLVKIFSYLNPRELSRCSGVCRQWRQSAYDPLLWRNLHPVCWARGKWEFSESDTIDLPLSKSKMQCRMNFDEDADVDESSSSDDDFCCHSALEQRHVACERFMMHSLITNFLPHIGSGVQRVVLSASRGLTSSMLHSIFNLCPNIIYLDISYTSVTDSAFKGLKPGVSSCLEHLDLSGCGGVSDVGILRLANSMILCDREFSLCTLAPLHFLSFSGCHLLTDKSLRVLLEMKLLKCLEYLDVSGCWSMTGQMLQRAVDQATNLLPQNIFYCDHIRDGPYPSEANGCQNLECEMRACCCGRG